jgi:hypothetical protein
MARKERRYAKPVKRIIDKKTREVVGWLYQWNTGHLVPMWKDEEVENIEYV